jgi:hypothetical protein
MACLESIKKFINNNIYNLFIKKENFEYYLMKNTDENNLNEHLMNENKISEILTIDDENMIRSMIKENNNLIKSCENDKDYKKHQNDKYGILMTEKEIEDILNNNFSGVP